MTSRYFAVGVWGIYCHSPQQQLIHNGMIGPSQVVSGHGVQQGQESATDLVHRHGRRMLILDLRREIMRQAWQYLTGTSELALVMREQGGPIVPPSSEVIPGRRYQLILPDASGTGVPSTHVTTHPALGQPQPLQQPPHPPHPPHYPSSTPSQQRTAETQRRAPRPLLQLQVTTSAATAAAASAAFVPSVPSVPSSVAPSAASAASSASSGRSSARHTCAVRGCHKTCTCAPSSCA